MTQQPAPSWPASDEDATASRLARYYTAQAVIAWRQFTDLPRPTPEIAEEKDRLVGEHITAYAVAALLRALAEVDPARADAEARDLWVACDEGGGTVESSYEWAVEYGLDPDALTDEEPDETEAPA